MTTKRLCTAVILMGLWGSACGVPEEIAPGDPEASPEASEQSGDALLAGVRYIQNYGWRGAAVLGCQSPMNLVPFLEKAMFHGRVASQSGAFQECIGNLHAGMFPYTQPYNYCPGDPFPLGHDGQREVTQREQVYEVLLRARSRSNLTINCSGGNGDYLARAGYKSSTTDQEEMVFNWKWLSTVARAPSPPDDPAWPIWQVTATIWHEAMHNYTYRHDGGCSLPNTVPYIVDACMGQVLTISGNRCGLDRCGPGALNLVKSLNSSDCECVSDPRR